MNEKSMGNVEEVYMTPKITVIEVRVRQMIATSPQDIPPGGAESGGIDPTVD